MEPANELPTKAPQRWSWAIQEVSQNDGMDRKQLLDSHHKVFTQGWNSSFFKNLQEINHFLEEWAFSSWFFFPVCRSICKEQENQVGYGDVWIRTYLYLFSDQSASFFDLTWCSFSIYFQ